MKRRYTLISEEWRRWRAPWATRNGEPWSVAEDRRLLRLFARRLNAGMKPTATAGLVSRELHRTPMSALTRFYALQTGARLARMASMSARARKHARNRPSRSRARPIPR